MGAKTGSRPAACAAEVERFLATLAAGLPVSGLWSSPVLVAVSGGADSVAMLCALRELAPPDAGVRMTVVHAEHDLRNEAAGDRQFVAELAARLGLPFVWQRCAVRSAVDLRGEGLEALARRARYGFLIDVAIDTGARHVMVAHTADDQAETILHRALRGTGLAGLGGMPAARQLIEGVSLLRPLLAASRRSVREFLTASGQEWREDATNADVRYARNFIRHDVLACCERGPYPAATEALVRLGRQAALAAGAIRSAAEHLLEPRVTRRADGTVVLRTAGLAGLDRHLVAEMFVALWSREGWPQRDMTAAHYATLAALAFEREGCSKAAEHADFPGRIHVRGGRSDGLEFRPLERSDVAADRVTS